MHGHVKEKKLNFDSTKKYFYQKKENLQDEELTTKNKYGGDFRYKMPDHPVTSSESDFHKAKLTSIRPKLFIKKFFCTRHITFFKVFNNDRNIRMML